MQQWTDNDYCTLFMNVIKARRTLFVTTDMWDKDAEFRYSILFKTYFQRSLWKTILDCLKQQEWKVYNNNSDEESGKDNENGNDDKESHKDKEKDKAKEKEKPKSGGTKRKRNKG